MEIWKAIILLLGIVFGLKQTKPEAILVPTPTIELNKSVDVEVTFTSQAPLGEWGDYHFQDGCEEASALMIQCAIHKTQCPVLNGRIDSHFAREEIIAATTGVDTSANDTADLILKEHYGIDDVQVIEVPDWQAVVTQLQNNKLIIAPMDGRKLDNPYYTAPGPERHMILIKGFDFLTKEFITNDPGTKRGANYRYPAYLFWDAIRDYPTGDHVPIENVEKRMIVVGVK